MESPSKNRKRKISAVVKAPLNDVKSPENVKELKRTKSPLEKNEKLTIEQLAERFPVLKNEELVNKFLGVTMTNNQKGRIRQVLKDNLKGTSELLLPDVIHNRIQAILKSSENLNDSDLRKIRILYNMLKTATEKPVTKNIEKKTDKKVKKKKLKENDETTAEKKAKKLEANEKGDVIKKETLQKVKGPKRYVVFLGNLPLDVNKEKIMKHFSEMSELVKDIRIPKRAEGKKSAIAYLEVANEPSYELALSKHHSMLDNRRINVQYTTQQNSKITKTEAKSKSAKLVALQKSGKLLGSVPLNRKRSQRRKKMKAAQKKAETETT